MAYRAADRQQGRCRTYTIMEAAVRQNPARHPDLVDPDIVLPAGGLTRGWKVPNLSASRWTTPCYGAAPILRAVPKSPVTVLQFIEFGWDVVRCPDSVDA